MRTFVPWEHNFALFYWMKSLQLAAARRIAQALYGDIALAGWLR